MAKMGFVPERTSDTFSFASPGSIQSLHYYEDLRQENQRITDPMAANFNVAKEATSARDAALTP